ncbi:MAG: hypothetical protein QXU72_02405 [Thermofilum sp.]
MTGWSTVLVTERRHPYIDRYWPPGHIIGGSTPSSTRCITSSTASSETRMPDR